MAGMWAATVEPFRYGERLTGKSKQNYLKKKLCDLPVTFVARGEAVYFAHQIIRDLFSREPNDRNIKCAGLLLNDPIERGQPGRRNSRAGHSSKARAFGQVRNICNHYKRGVLVPK